MISIVKYLFENITVDFLRSNKQVNKQTKKQSPFAIQSVYNTPAGQESGEQLLTKLGK